ncbi:MAG: hypothetical protein ABIS86_18830 [Streptosporangiaceae bacterium]
MRPPLTRARLLHPGQLGTEIVVSVRAPGGSLRVGLTRQPVAEPGFVDEHLLVDGTHDEWRTIADVLVVDAGPLPDPDDLSTGWSVAAAGSLLVTRSGWYARLVPSAGRLDRTVLGHCASVVHFWVAAGGSPEMLDGAVLSVGGLICQVFGSASRAASRAAIPGAWGASSAR